MKAPSFFVENESSTGLTLQYRSKRRGFNYYTMGKSTEHFNKIHVILTLSLSFRALVFHSFTTNLFVTFARTSTVGRTHTSGERQHSFNFYDV